MFISLLALSWIVATPTQPVLLVPPVTVQEEVKSPEPDFSTATSTIIYYADQADIDDQIAIAVAKAESGLDPTQYNPEWHYNKLGEKVCQGSFGLYQIACVNYAGDPNDLYDPKLNIEIAFKIHKDRGGWSKDWVNTCKKIKCS